MLKCHGCKNDIFLIEAAPAGFASVAELTAFIRHLCHRGGPLGSDGVYFFRTGRQPGPAVGPAGAQRALDPVIEGGGRTGEAAADAWFFNPDGSAAEVCGNGLRCVGRVILDRHSVAGAVIRTGRYEFAVRRAPTTAEGVCQVAVDLPAVDFEPRQPIVAGRRALIDAEIPELGSRLRFTAVAAPNPHLVALVDSYAEDELIAIGERVAASPAVFPAGANVSFLLPISTAEIFVGTYERGVGLTLSCGSAVVASRAAYSRVGRCDPASQILVRAPGGPARVTLRAAGGGWLPTLEGNATRVYRASVDPAALAAGRPGPVQAEHYTGEQSAYAVLDEGNLKALAASGVHVI